MRTSITILGEQLRTCNPFLYIVMQNFRMMMQEDRDIAKLIKEFRAKQWNNIDWTNMCIC